MMLQSPMTQAAEKTRYEIFSDEIALFAYSSYGSSGGKQRKASKPTAQDFAYLLRQ